MTVPLGVPNLPVGALTLETLAAQLQDQTVGAMRAAAGARMPSIFDASTGGAILSDLSPFGIITHIWAGFMATIAAADPADVDGPEDLPGLLLDFIEGLPVIGQLVQLLEAIAGTYTGTDPVLLEIQEIFLPIRKLIDGWTDALRALRLPDPISLVQQLPLSIPALARDVEGGLTAVGSGLTRGADGAITFVEDGLTHLVQQADQGIVSLGHISEQLVHAAGLIANPSMPVSAAPVANPGVADVMAAGHTAAVNASGMIDGIVQAARNDASLVGQTFETAAAELAGFWSGLTAHASGGNTASPPPASAQDAVLAVGTIQERLAIIGNGAEEQVDIEFADYSNGALPADWTILGPNGWSISGGLLLWNGGASGSALYSKTLMLTDYQSVSAVFHSLSGDIPGILARRGTLNQLLMRFTGTYWELRTSSTLLCTFNDSISFDVPYTLLCGDAANLLPLKFQFLKNGTPLTVSTLNSGSGLGTATYSDDSSISSYGGSYREAGISALGGGTFTISSFKFQDTTPSSPSVLVTPNESTSSTTYTDLATTSDEVAVNIGSSGMALVTVRAQITPGGSWGGCMSYAMSGANTASAVDSKALILQDETNSSSIRAFSATIVETGLSPGLTVFKAKYRSLNSGVSCAFSDRRVGVVAL
jgi:hypothetical protein